MVRTTLIPQNKEVHFLIPDEYIGKKIEITCLPVEEIEEAGKEQPKFDASSIKGIFSQEVGERYIQYIDEVRKEWDRDILR